jgi:uncharacterized protein (TIGR02453 family)
LVLDTVQESPMVTTTTADPPPATVGTAEEVPRMPPTASTTTATSVANFEGWPPEAFEFYEGLQADNSKAYWTAHRDTFERAVRAPLLAFAAAVEAEFGPMHLFRPHRDVRFSKDKSPYKTQLGAVTEGDDGEIYYVHVAAEGLVAGSGAYHMASDQLQRHRAALDDDESGDAIMAIVARLEAAGYRIAASDELKSAPRGFRRDHPRIRLLRLKGLVAMRTFEPAAWMGTPEALTRLVDIWRGCQPLNNWLARHVGPSEEPPEDADAW